MAANFDYVQAKNTINNIEELKNRLKKVLDEADNLIKTNVNNDNVWSSDSAFNFLNSWNKYSSQSFPTYIASFEGQIRNLTTALQMYSGAEQ